MKKVLVLGASGYVGAQLLPLLLNAGYHTTAASRHIETLHARLPTHPNLTRLTLDLADRQKTLATIPNYDLVFFLVHGMAHGGDFVDYELSLAQNVNDALDLAHSQVQHVIYLSSLQPESGRSPHLQARYATGQILRQSRIPITELRAGLSSALARLHSKSCAILSTTCQYSLRLNGLTPKPIRLLWLISTPIY